MSDSLRSKLLLVLRVLVIVLQALDPALTLAGRHSDPYVPLWFKCAWAVAAIIAVALPDVLRRGYMAVLVGMVYWDGLARVWSWLARASQGRRRNALARNTCHAGVKHLDVAWPRLVMVGRPNASPLRMRTGARH